jgi:hypothetical protein
MQSARLATIFFLALALRGFAQQPGFFQISVVCGTESRHGWAQVFADTPDGWRQFDALAHLPHDTHSVAKIWKGPFGNTLVLVSLNRRDLVSQTTYCFHADGSLLALDHQVQTGWGWSFSRTQRYRQGELQSTYSHFIDLKHGGEVARPGRLKHMTDSAGALDPPAYAQFADLPFASLFHPLRDSEKY